MQDTLILEKIEKYYRVEGIFKNILGILLLNVNFADITKYKKIEIAESFDFLGYKDEKKIYYKFYPEQLDIILKKISDIFLLIDFNALNLLVNIKKILKKYNNIKLTIGITVINNSLIIKIFFDCLLKEFNGNIKLENKFIEEIKKLGIIGDGISEGNILTHLSIDYNFDINSYNLISNAVKTYYSEGNINGEYLDNIYDIVNYLNYENNKYGTKYNSFHSMIRHKEGNIITNKLYLLYDDKKSFVLNLFYIFTFFKKKVIFEDNLDKILNYDKPEYIGIDFNESGVVKIDLYGFL